jgi:dihydroflavonol-4-reductase
MVLITGGTGLVGRHLLEVLLAAGEQVRALHRPSSDRKQVLDFLQKKEVNTSELEWFEAELWDVERLEEALQGCSRVYHCAAVVSFHHRDADRMMEVNRDATAKLVNSMLHLGTGELIHVSSVSALGRKEGEPVHESVPFEEGADVTHYARSKYLAEIEVWRGKEEGLKVLVVNPVIILGPGDFARSSSTMFALAHKGFQWFPSGSNGFVSATDVARACHLLATHECWNERYMLCAENLPYRQVLTWMAEALSTRPPVHRLRSWMMGLAWRFGRVFEIVTGRISPITRESVQNTNKVHAYESDFLERTLERKGCAWEYESIQSTIEKTAPYVLGDLGATK